MNSDTTSRVEVLTLLQGARDLDEQETNDVRKPGA